MEQKIKQDTGIPIGKNIRQIRLAMGLKQTEVVRRVQLLDVPMTRETLVKIERGVQHITASWMATRPRMTALWPRLAPESKK